MARREHDYYPTPRYPVARLLEAVSLPQDIPWLEPACGDGALLRHVASMGYDVRWLTNEIRDVPAPALSADHCRGRASAWLWAWRRSNGHKKRGLCFMNPPFNGSEGIVAAAVASCEIVVCLLPTSWLGTQGRTPWLRENTPAAFYVPERVSFTGDGGSGNQNYAWLAWGLGHTSNHFLGDTPKTERRRDEAESAGVPLPTNQPSLFGEEAA